MYRWTDLLLIYAAWLSSVFEIQPNAICPSINKNLEPRQFFFAILWELKYFFSFCLNATLELVSQKTIRSKQHRRDLWLQNSTREVFEIFLFKNIFGKNIKEAISDAWKLRYHNLSNTGSFFKQTAQKKYFKFKEWSVYTSIFLTQILLTNYELEYWFLEKMDWQLLLSDFV